MAHPITLQLTDESLERNRLTVAFRLILAIPHLIWSALWGFVTGFAVIISWFATLFAGTTPLGLHNFIALYTRYFTHVSAYLLLIADPYPGFVADKPIGVDLVIAPPARQNRWITGFRLILVIPAAIVSRVLIWLAFVVAFIAWFVILFTGAIPAGMRDLNAWILRFTAQTDSYMSLLTDRYPSFSLERDA